MFKILKSSHKSEARLGELTTKNGVLQTPFFMPDATRAVLKNLSVAELENLGLAAMVVNTFHLYLQPGLEIIKKNNGVHKFMNWPGPLLADSGGYQIFSLIHKSGKMGKIYDSHVEFRSPADGSLHKMTPEKSIQIQFDLGVNMLVVLDDCPPNNYSHKQIYFSVERTISWAKRCHQEFDKQIKKRKITEKNKPLLFGVIQGGENLELRKKCASELVKIGFDGLGFGARHVDEEGNFLTEVLKTTAESIPINYLRFALGIGKPEDIVRAVKMGWDMFDCVIPTREGRHGRIYQGKWKMENGKSNGKNNFYKILNINNAEFTRKNIVINKNSKLKELREYSLSYLHHLFKIGDPLGQRLVSLNNLEFYLDLMVDLHYGIKKGQI
ncbi:MAG TPA: tRNA guanosine(34) transglycosylase Tgt [bacterium]|nr:tRNA guanosine(34) transglycosylase Tgt [bacterium]